MGNSKTKLVDPTKEYYQLVADSTISGATWEEFASNLRRHIDNSDQLRKEWEQLGAKEREKTKHNNLFTAATLPDNIPKNRYNNILPYDSTRVKLTESDDQNDYINASYVNTNSKNYICSQAPLQHTVADFHRMLWETDARIVVMLTRFVEDGKPKATKYLPEKGDPPVTYSDLEVEVLEEEESTPNGAYIIRKFSLSKGSEKKMITHFHFVAWPDHGVPDEATIFLDMILRVNQMEEEMFKSLNKRNPTVVHCSAGIGRTGTYIIVNSVLEEITAAINSNGPPPTLNLMKTVHQLRSMRSGMVTHLEQYSYCYKTILAHIEHLLNEKNGSNKQESNE